jgi:hypothetical protein
MNVSEWRSAKESYLLVNYLRQRDDIPDRKWRLFACASVRTVWDMIGEEVCREAVEVAELYADGRVGRAVAEQVKRSAELLTWPSQAGYAPYTAEYVASQAVITDEGRECTWCASWVSGMVWQVMMARWEEDCFDEMHPTRTLQECGILPQRGDWPGGMACPLCPRRRGALRALAECRRGRGRGQAPRDQPGVRWHRRGGAGLTHGELDLARLAILCDALEEGGCTGSRLLTHLRAPGPHYRGCDALDAVLTGATWV